MRSGGGLCGLWLATLVMALAPACSSSGGPDPDAGPDAMDAGEDGSAGDGDGAVDAGDPDGGDGDLDQADGDDGLPDCSEHLFEDVQIPMRDGESLAAFLRRPVDPACRMPTILLQTPYNKENARALWFADSTGEPLFDSRDYAFVVVDWRGFFGSRDAAVQGTQPHGLDGYDTVEWIAAQPWSNGAVGTWGVSALCAQQYKTAAEQPPHLAAMVPIFCQANTTYDQYYPGGVLRREYFDFIAGYYGGGDLILDHPTRDALWRAIEGLLDLARIQAPCLVVAGWYDLFNTGTLRDFRQLQTSGPADLRDEHRLLVGPWIHFAAGGESQAGGQALDEQELRYCDTDKRIQADSLAFFDYHLRGLDGPAAGWAAARWLTGGDRVWEDGPRWPPIGAQVWPFYPAAGGLLAGQAPAGGELSFPYDPDDPSPTVGGSTLLPSLDHGPRDQAPVIARADALTFASAPLLENIRLRAAARVSLRVSTTGADTDFAVRLTDVDPDGVHLLVGEGMGRLKLRDDLGAPAEVQPGQVYDLEITLANELAYTFAAGHRVGLIVSSSNHPRFARNPNDGADFYVDEASSVSVTNSLHLGPDTVLVLPSGQ